MPTPPADLARGVISVIMAGLGVVSFAVLDLSSLIKISITLGCLGTALLIARRSAWVEQKLHSVGQ